MSRVIGADEMLRDLQTLGNEMPKVEKEMLMAGGEAMAESWEQEIEARGFVASGEMLKNVRAKTKNRKGAMRAEVTAYGSVKRTVKTGKNKGKQYEVRNAAKAYMLHYGTSRIHASHWIDAAEDHGMPLVTAAMAGRLGEALNNTIGGKGT